MAVAVSNITRSIQGNRRVVYADVTFDSSYPTGGESLTAANLGLSSKIDFLTAQSTGGYTFEFIHSTSLLKVFVEEAAAAGGPLLELANATDISTVVTRVKAEGV